VAKLGSPLQASVRKVVLSSGAAPGLRQNALDLLVSLGSSVSSALQFPNSQARAETTPLDGGGRDLHYFGGLLDGQAGEEAKFDDADCWIEAREILQRMSRATRSNRARGRVEASPGEFGGSSAAFGGLVRAAWSTRMRLIICAATRRMRTILQ